LDQIKFKRTNEIFGWMLEMPRSLSINSAQMRSHARRAPLSEAPWVANSGPMASYLGFF
jgi:hypothetical protein